MSFKIDQDPVTKRWYAWLLDEPGKPRIETDDPKLLENFWNDICAGNIARVAREKHSAPARS